MKFKFHWGHAIILVILLFIGSVVWRIMISYRYEVDLVDKDYYPKDIEHQKHITKLANTEKSGLKISIVQTTDSVVFCFPGSGKEMLPSGIIHFYNPADFHKDATVSISVDSEKVMRISKSGLDQGRYLIKIDWNLDSTEFYQEAEIFISRQ